MDTKASAAADAIAKSPDLSFTDLYTLATVFSLVSARHPPADADVAAARAVTLLRRALAKGYANIPHLLKDADLDPLRRRADYADLLWDLADGPAFAK